MADVFSVFHDQSAIAACVENLEERAMLSGLAVVSTSNLSGVQVQSEPEYGADNNAFQSEPIHRVRVAYLIPSNREPQAEGVANLQANIIAYQAWMADQMERQGFGPKTFAYETEADGVTPLIHVENLPNPDSFYVGADQFQTYDKIMSAANDVGISTFANGDIWLLVHEAHIQNSDGSKVGGTALGAGSGSGSSGGVAVVDSAVLSLLDLEGLRDNREYAGLTIPSYGQHPLVFGESFPGFEGTTISSIASSFQGAMLHELLHGFGLPHNFLNDNNFHGNVMGNGLRGWRGYVYPDLYPDDVTSLERASAVILNASRYLQPFEIFTDRLAPGLTVNSTVNFVNGQVQIDFSANDAVGLAAATLSRSGENIGHMVLTGTSVNSTFETPYYTAGSQDDFTVEIIDTSGNKTRSSIQYTPPATGNHAPKPKIRASAELVVPGQSIRLSALGSTDIDQSSGLLVEWDTDGDGTFDTPISSDLTFTFSYATTGTRLVQARVRDSQGATALSSPIAIRTVATIPTLNFAPNIDDQQFNLLEHATNGTELGTIAASDPNVNQHLTYSIDAGNTNGAFSLNAATGMLTVANSSALDIQVNPTFSLTILVTDDAEPSLSSTATITVLLAQAPQLNLEGPEVFWTKKDPPVKILPQLTVTGNNLAGAVLSLSMNAVGSSRKAADQFQSPSATTIGLSTGLRYANGRFTLEIELNETVTANSVQSFLRSISFSTKGKGLKIPTRELDVTLDATGAPTVSISQTIQVRKKLSRISTDRSTPTGRIRGLDQSSSRK